MMSKRSLDEIRFLVFGVLLVCGGGTLLNQARSAGPTGRVVMHAKSDGTYTISARAAAAQGLCLLAPGVAMTLYGLSRLRPADGRLRRQITISRADGRIASGSAIVGLLLFMALMGACWDFLLRAVR